MLRFLQKSKARKGFTIIELIVVVAIIGVMMAVILPMMNSERSRIEEARSAAADFYAAVQTAMTKYSLFDTVLSPAYSEKDRAADPEKFEKNYPGIIRHYAKMGGNYPYDKNANIKDHEYPAATSLYILVYANNDIIESVGAVSRAKSNPDTEHPGLYTLLSKDADHGYVEYRRGSSTINAEFGRLFASEIDNRINFRDGYYYARVDFIPPTNGDGTINKEEINSQTVKVAFAAYTRKALPKVSGTAAAYENANLYFGSDFKLNCGEVCGTCAPFQNSTGDFPNQFVGLAGTKMN